MAEERIAPPAQGDPPAQGGPPPSCDDETRGRGGGRGGRRRALDTPPWMDTWERRIECWWLGLPLATQSELYSCGGALAVLNPPDPTRPPPSPPYTHPNPPYTHPHPP